MATDDEFLKQFNEHFQKMTTGGVEGEELSPEEAEGRRGRELNEREVRIRGVYEHPQSGAFVLLRDSRGRNLPIWIGQPEAISISLAIEGQSPQRPMTHDLLKLVMERLNATVEMVLIDDLYNNVFYAKLVLRRTDKSGEKSMEIDCRPSDAIATGIRFRAPIYVADAVLEEGQCELNEE